MITFDSTYHYYGVKEIGGFDYKNQADLERDFGILVAGFNRERINDGLATFATTIKQQIGAIKFLKSHRFRKIARWKGLHGRYITLWFRHP